MDEVILLRKYPWSNSSREIINCKLTELSKEDVADLFFGFGILDLPRQIDFKSRLDERPQQIGSPYLKGARVYCSYDFPIVSHHQDDLIFTFNFSNTQSSYAIALKSVMLEPFKAIFERYKDKDYLLEWANFFDELNDECTQGYLSYFKVAKKIRDYAGDKKEAQMSLIVTISDLFAKSLPNLVATMRNTLARNRTIMPLERVTEIDPNCVQWLIRQPGESLNEKIAAHNCQIMGLSRYQNLDLLENKVLKEFIIRCQNEALHYIVGIEASRNKDNFAGSLRYRKVKAFKSLCANLLKSPELSVVKRQRGLPSPNYVLLHDNRYKKVWTYYLKLLKKEREKDSLWSYQKQTFCDIALTLLQAAFCELSQESFESLKIIPICDANLVVNSEQDLGRRVDSQSVSGPYHLLAGQNHYLVEFVADLDAKTKAQDNNRWQSIYPDLQDLASFGARCFMVLTDIEDHKKYIYPIYTLHNPFSQDKSTDNLLDSLTQSMEALEKRGQILYPLILQSSFDRELFANDTKEDSSGHTFKVRLNGALALLSVYPQDWNKSLDDLKHLLASILRISLQ